MRYVYPDFKALRFRYKGGGVNCFWKDLFDFRIKHMKIIGVIWIQYSRFRIFWRSFFEGMKHLI